MGTVWRVLTRKKILDPVSAEQSELGRVLNTWDLTALGVGSTLGVGVYVLAGQVALNTAGPAVVLSFVIATIASVFAGLCYAEFGARAPRAGSAYIYSYVCVGEFVAFVIGWNLILEYVIGSASVARSLSLYLDSLLNGTLQNTFHEIAPIDNISFMSKYFDFFAFGISVFLAIALAFGLKESSLVNNIFTVLNLFVVVFVVIAGAVHANTSNWDLPANKTGHDDQGGFFPFGVEGMIKGAATCFYGFVGFDCIATTGEEVKNPKRAIPIAIICSLFIIFLAYFGTSTIITLMVPFYDQDPQAPLPYAFEKVNMSWAKWVVTIGGLFGLCASLFGAMFPLPRIIYAMASDSLVFRFLGRVSPRFKTPVTGTLLAGLLTGLMSALFELKQLIDMMSIGTLLAYTIVAASVLLLRYTENEPLDPGSSEELELMSGELTSSNVFKQIFNCGGQSIPSELSEKLVKIQVCLYCLLCVFIGVCAMYLKDWIKHDSLWGIILMGIIVGLTVLVLMSITTQPQSRKELSFKVPLVPLIPALSILINIYLMLMLDVDTWIRLGVWMSVGLPTYYFSVQTHSDARNDSICSLDSSNKPSGKLNGFTNHGYINDEQYETKPPLTSNIEATIAVLDEVLEKEEANIDEDLIDRKLSVDTMSNASNVLREENVHVVVHCPDLPNMSVEEVKPLTQSNDLNNTLPSDVIFPNPASQPPVTVLANDITTFESNVDKDITKFEDSETNSVEVETTLADNGNDILINEIEADVSQNDEDFVIPPPPPMVKEIENVSIPRPYFNLNDINKVKLKSWNNKKPKTPPVDYSREHSVAPDSDDNLKFDSVEYKEFRDQLANTLQKGYVPPVPIDLKRSILPVKVEPVLNEDVIVDKIDRDEAKKAFTLYLERINNVSITEKDPENNNKNIETKDAELNEDVNEENKNEVSQNVEEKQLKNLDKKQTKYDQGSDQLQHKQNMDSIFKSIRLRKVESFKAQESQ